MSPYDKIDQMIETYLAAVAGQLPEAQAEDIVAELRDEILARIEAHGERLGRAMTNEEVEALLREVGHPLVVAARYGSSPQGLIGPELYPWWMFAARLSLIALLFIAAMRIISGLLFGQEGFGDVILRAIHDFIGGSITVAGILAISGWIIERQEKKPKFFTEWRVRDLEIFTRAASVEKRWFGFITGAEHKRAKDSAKPLADRSDFSPVAGAATSAVFVFIALMWWMGYLGGPRESVLATEAGANVWVLLKQVHQLLYWPVAVLMMARIVFDLLRVVTGSPVRFTAFGDLAFSIASMGVLVWLWAASPLASTIRVGSIEEFLARFIGRESWIAEPLPTLLMSIVVIGLICEFIKSVGLVGRLIAKPKTRGLN